MCRAEPRRVAVIGAALQHGMADEGRGQAVAGEERRLEGQQAKQLIPQSVIVQHTSFAPSPGLWRHVMHAPDAEWLDRL